MSIDGRISRFLPVRDADGDRIPTSKPGIPFAATTDFAGDSGFEGNEIEVYTGDMVSNGPAYADHGNNFNGYPQHHMEIRSDAQTAYGYRNVAGNIVLDLALATVFRLQISGPTSISISMSDWPVGAYPRTVDADTGAGIDIAGSIIIENPSKALVGIAADHWGPSDVAPTLNKAFMEVGVAVSWMPGFSTIVRAYPAINPKDPA